RCAAAGGARMRAASRAMSTHVESLCWVPLARSATVLLCGGIAPGGSVSDEGIEDGEKLSDAGDDGDLLWLAAAKECVAEFTHDLVMGHRHKGGHVENHPDVGPSSGDDAMSSQRAAVAVEWSDPDEGGDLAAG